LQTHKAKQKNPKELPSKRTETPKTMDRQATTERTPAANRVDGLTGFFTDEVRLSHLSAEM